MREARVEVWAYCLMPSQVRLILGPETEDGLARAIGAAHRRWAGFVNVRGRWTGHLFDGRYASVAMDETHLMTCIRYVALNPVRAGLAASVWDWPWSSVHAHGRRTTDGVVTVEPVLDRVDDLRAFLAGDADEPDFAALRTAEGIGRPVGNDAFVAELERRLGRPVARRAPGRKPRAAPPGQLSLI